MISAWFPTSRWQRMRRIFKPDIVALTSMTTSYHYVEQLAARSKAALSVPVIIGGPHATSLPDGTLANPNIDFLIFGEGEYIFRDFLRATPAGDTHWEQIQGLWYKENGKIIPGGSRKPIEDPDVLPWPSRHLFDLGKYPLYAPNGEPMLTILSSRGRPYNCSSASRASWGVRITSAALKTLSPNCVTSLKPMAFAIFTSLMTCLPLT